MAKTKKKWARPVLVVLVRENATAGVLIGCKRLVPGGGGQAISATASMGNSCSYYRYGITPADPDCYNYCNANVPS